MSTGIGDTLRAARRQQGATLADAAAETRIRESYLAALEEEQFAALGGAVYVKGFLRSYAKYLRLDAEPLLEAFREHYEPPEEAAHVSATPSQPVERDRPQGVVIAGVALLLLLIALAAIGLVGGGEDDAEEGDDAAVAPPPVTEPTEEPTEAEEPPDGADEVEETETAEPAPDIDGVEVEVTVTGSESWMRIEVDGVNVLEGPREGGFSETFTADDEVVLRIGAPEAVEIVVNGEDQGEVGAPGEPVDLTYTADNAG